MGMPSVAGPLGASGRVSVGHLHTRVCSVGKTRLKRGFCEERTVLTPVPGTRRCLEEGHASRHQERALCRVARVQEVAQAVQPWRWGDKACQEGGKSHPIKCAVRNGPGLAP